MWLTIYADAGYQQHRSHGYYGYWATCDEGRLKGSGTTPKWVGSSISAETYGMYKAARDCIEKWPHVTGILFCCDCTNALDIIKFNSDRVVAGELAYMQQQMQRLSRVLKIRVKWVRGHQLDDSTESYLNRFCDREAAKHKKK